MYVVTMREKHGRKTAAHITSPAGEENSFRMLSHMPLSSTLFQTEWIDW